MTWIDIPAKPVALDPPVVELAGGAASLAAVNGRVATSLARPRRQTLAHPLPDGFVTTQIFGTAGFVVVVGEAGVDGRQSVQVRDAAGKLRRTIVGGRSDWVIDPRGPTLLGTSDEGTPTAWALGDPSARPFAWSARLDGRHLEDIRISGAHLIVMAVEGRSFSNPSPNVLIQLLHVPDFGDVSRRHMLRGAQRLAERLAERTPRAALGVEVNGPVLATLDHVYWGDWRLAPRAEADTPGVPVVVAPRGDGRTWSLWHTAQGPVLRRMVPGAVDHEQVVHDAFGDLGALLVGRDNSVTLVAPARIEQFDAAGTLRFKFNCDSPADAFVDDAGTVLFAQESKLLAVAPTGHTTDVWTAPESASRLGVTGIVGDRVWTVVDHDLVALDVISSYSHTP